MLAVAKKAVKDTYRQKDRETYIISIVNSGTTAITGVTISDNLGGYANGTGTLVPLDYIAGTTRYYVNGVLQATPAVTAGPPLTISGISIPAGGNVIIAYETELNQYAPLGEGAEITNTVTVSGGGITPITAQETINAQMEPVLTITKSVSPVPVTENGTLTYTFGIQNSGSVPATAATGAVVTDTFDPILTNLTVSYNGNAWTEPTEYTYNATTGEFATVAGQITVPAATYTQDAATGAWVVNPGVGTLIVTGTV